LPTRCGNSFCGLPRNLASSTSCAGAQCERLGVERQRAQRETADRETSAPSRRPPSKEAAGFFIHERALLSSAFGRKSLLKASKSVLLLERSVGLFLI
jgi:hypothetical protein